MDFAIAPHLSERNTFILFQNDGTEIKFRVTKLDFIVIGQGNLTVAEGVYIRRNYLLKS